MTLSALKATDFEPYVGDEFAVTAPGQQVPFKLTAVERSGAALREGGAFSLLFLAAAGPFLPQGVYPLTHATLGTHELFVVPLGPEDGQNRYQVVFT
jgi:hypothetical protein